MTCDTQQQGTPVGGAASPALRARAQTSRPLRSPLSALGSSLAPQAGFHPPTFVFFCFVLLLFFFLLRFVKNSQLFHWVRSKNPVIFLKCRSDFTTTLSQNLPWLPWTKD